MKGCELKIIFEGDSAYLVSGKMLSLAKLGLDGTKIFKVPAYWNIRVINYLEKEKRLFCEILRYNLGKTEFDNVQMTLRESLNGIEKVSFKNIDTNGLLRTREGKANGFIRHKSSFESAKYQNQSSAGGTIPGAQNLEFTFSISLKRINFGNGVVTFQRKFPELKEKVEFSILNSNIREEFDAVKDYFSKIFGSKKIEVTVKVEITDGNVSHVDALSPQISQIDASFIEQVKSDFIRSKTSANKHSESDLKFYTKDELFTSFGDELGAAKAFCSNEQEFFDDVLEISKTKHYRYLRFLSTKHVQNLMKLRFVLKPFSFLFLLEGSKNYYVVWETLDTEEATYVWCVQKDINEVRNYLRKVEKVIGEIKVHGKMNYIKAAEDSFFRIYHDYSDENGFEKWKRELKELII